MYNLDITQITLYANKTIFSLNWMAENRIEL